MRLPTILLTTLALLTTTLPASAEEPPLPDPSDPCDLHPALAFQACQEVLSCAEHYGALESCIEQAKEQVCGVTAADVCGTVEECTKLYWPNDCGLDDIEFCIELANTLLPMDYCPQDTVDAVKGCFYQTFQSCVDGIMETVDFCAGGSSISDPVCPVDEVQKCLTMYYPNDCGDIVPCVGDPCQVPCTPPNSCEIEVCGDSREKLCNAVCTMTQPSVCSDPCAWFYPDPCAGTGACGPTTLVPECSGEYLACGYVAASWAACVIFQPRGSPCIGVAEGSWYSWFITQVCVVSYPSGWDCAVVTIGGNVQPHGHALCTYDGGDHACVFGGGYMGDGTTWQFYEPVCTPDVDQDDDRVPDEVEQQLCGRQLTHDAINGQGGDLGWCASISDYEPRQVQATVYLPTRVEVGPDNDGDGVPASVAISGRAITAEAPSGDTDQSYWQGPAIQVDPDDGDRNAPVPHDDAEDLVDEAVGTVEDVVDSVDGDHDGVPDDAEPWICQLEDQNTGADGSCTGSDYHPPA